MPPSSLRRPRPQQQSKSKSMPVSGIKSAPTTAPKGDAAALMGVHSRSNGKSSSPTYQWQPTPALQPDAKLPTATTYLVTPTPSGTTSLDAVAAMLQKLTLGAKAGGFVELKFSADIPLEVPGLVVSLKVSGKYAHVGDKRKLELDAVVGIGWRFLTLEVFRHLELTGGDLGWAFIDSVLQTARQKLIDIGLEQELRELVKWNDASLLQKSVGVMGDFIDYGTLGGSAVLLGKVLSTQMTRRQLIDLWKTYERVFKDIPGVGFEVSAGARLKGDGGVGDFGSTLSGDLTYGLEDVGKQKDKPVKFFEAAWGGKLNVPAKKAGTEMNFRSSTRWRADGSTQDKIALHGEFPAMAELAPIIAVMHAFIRAPGLWKALESARSAGKDKSSAFDVDALADSAAILAMVTLPYADRKLGFDFSITTTTEGGKTTRKVEAHIRVYQRSSAELPFKSEDLKVGVEAEMKFGAIIDLSAELQSEVDKRAAELEKEKKQFPQFKSQTADVPRSIAAAARDATYVATKPIPGSFALRKALLPPILLPVPKRIGIGRTHNPKADDMQHFDYPPKQLSLWSVTKLFLWAQTRIPPRGSRHFVTDVECLQEMAGVLVALAGSSGAAAFARFVAGARGVMPLGPTTPLGKTALLSPSFLAAAAAVRTSIETQLALQAASGALNPYALTVNVPLVDFGFSDGTALKAVIGGTQGEELCVTSFRGSAVTRKYSIGLRFVIYDHFGVDETDLYGPGLFPFWVLQHERSPARYAPFIHRLDLPFTLSGTF